MIGTILYIEGQKVDFFKDESIQLNSSIQNINDISKTFSDFTQSFSVPCSEINNRIFEHYYNSDIDGYFNPNVRISAYIEVGSFAFRYGIVQLEDVKLKNMRPYSYSIRFFSAVVNLSDKFADDDLQGLTTLDQFGHTYDSLVINSMSSDSLFAGNIYYPLISSKRFFDFGSNTANDIGSVGGQITFQDLKPALRLIKIIEAIESKYNFTFDRKFLNRAAFGNLFMWLHATAEGLNVAGQSEFIDLTNAGTISNASALVNLIDNTVEVFGGPTPDGDDIDVIVIFKIVPSAGYENTPYSIFITDPDGNVATQSLNLIGNGQVTFQTEDAATMKFKISTNQLFEYTPTIVAIRRHLPFISPNRTGTATQLPQSLKGVISIINNIPKMKVKDFITSIIKMFNLILEPTSANSFNLIPIDDWYAKGKLIDITKYVDSKDVTIKKPKLFKSILFQHSKSGQILNEQFRNNQGGIIGYGDLQADYPIDGGVLKINTQFENLMFNRLTDLVNTNITNIQVGTSLDKNLKPYVGKPYIFYKNGLQNYNPAIKSEIGNITKSFLTSTENDSLQSQITNSVNFSSDVSTFTLAENLKNLFSNYWKDYISDLYSTKRRVFMYTAYLPIGKIIQIKLNDQIVIKDKVYIINSMKSDLNTGKVDFELINYIGIPFNGQDLMIGVTVDSTLITVDSTFYTADQTFTTLQIAGVQFTSLQVSLAKQNFDCKITNKDGYIVTKVDIGFGTDWIDLEYNGDYLLIKVAESTIVRNMTLSVAIGLQTFTILIQQS